MSIKFSVGQRVRIVRVDEIPYGLKYSFLEKYLDNTGVVQEINAARHAYIVCLDEDKSLISLSENALEAED